MPALIMALVTLPTSPEEARALARAESAARVRASNPVTIEILSLAHALRLHEAAWLELEADVEAPAIFQSVGWAKVVLAWRAQSENGEQASRYHVLVAREGKGDVVGIWPLQIERTFGTAVAVALGDPFNQYSDILIRKGADQDMVVKAMVEALRALGTVSGVLMRKVRADAGAAGLSAHGSVVRSGEAAPAVDLAPHADFSAYHKTVKTKTRKNLRNARNRLERNGVALEHRVYDTRDAIAAALERSFALRSAWLDREGLTSRAFLNEGFARFVDALGTAHGDGLELLAFELVQGEEMLSIQWGFVHHGRYYAFIAARNPAFDAQSPGRLHLEDVIRSCAERGVSVVDFLAPDVDYKRTWATEMAAIEDHAIAFDWRGRLVLALQAGWPRRTAKALFDRLPNGLRQRLVRIVGVS